MRRLVVYRAPLVFFATLCQCARQRTILKRRSTSDNGPTFTLDTRTDQVRFFTGTVCLA